MMLGTTNIKLQIAVHCWCWYSVPT